jgi:hypothetical protein
VPFPRAHQRITWFGDAWQQQEEWSTGLRVDGTVPPTLAQLQALDDAFSTHIMSSGFMSISTPVRYVGLKVAPQDVNGLYGDGQAKEFLRPSVQTGVPGIGLPQATVVATLTTDTPRGLANEGRMYLPSTSNLPASDGRLSGQTVVGIRDAVIAFINAVDAVGIGSVSVFSKGTPMLPNGVARDVTGVRIGRVVDTQRRRRNSIPELYIAGVTNP